MYVGYIRLTSSRPFRHFEPLESEGPTLLPSGDPAMDAPAMKIVNASRCNTEGSRAQGPRCLRATASVRNREANEQCAKRHHMENGAYARSGMRKRRQPGRRFARIKLGLDRPEDRRSQDEAKIFYLQGERVLRSLPCSRPACSAAYRPWSRRTVRCR